MSKHPLFDDASQVAADGGEVIVDGPDGVAVSLTPEAAIETGEKLQDKGLEAAGQRRLRQPQREADAK
jgi:chemotaxis response regulator CheB